MKHASQGNIQGLSSTCFSAPMTLKAFEKLQHKLYYFKEYSMTCNNLTCRGQMYQLRNSSNIMQQIKYATIQYLDICGRHVPELKSVGDACVNHFSDRRLYV